MPKTLSLPNEVFEDLDKIAEELSHISKKPISLSMTVFLLTAVYRAHMSEPCARDAFRQRLASSQIMPPEEFEKALDKSEEKNK